MVDEELTVLTNQTVVTTVPKERPRVSPKDACLVVIYGDDIGKRIPLPTNKPAVVGRATDAFIQIDEDSVSRRHCNIALIGERFVLRDLQSTNGTHVNDEWVDQVDLRDGDLIKVGRTLLKFISSGNIEAQYHEEIYRLMTTDGLTEVANKRCFQETLEKEIGRCKRYDRGLSIVVLDIDHFKSINDTHGHLAGDAVLRQLGTLLRDRVRQHDIPARIGGEEFAVLMPEVKIEGATILAEELRRLVQTTEFRFEDIHIPLTVSLGVAEWNASFENGEMLVRVADDRLYRAKQSGRNRVVFQDS